MFVCFVRMCLCCYWYEQFVFEKLCVLRDSFQCLIPFRFTLYIFNVIQRTVFVLDLLFIIQREPATIVEIICCLLLM
ncbi:hypothetical protein HanIR_Chr01g0006491 [Helianthus annuus]|nr:hypothetical protein HanIR_Chr01g0006491 [Helianthus annuus]